MMPYASSENNYWTGFYTSRPNNKSFVRHGLAQYQAVSKIFAGKVVNQKIEDDEIKQIEYIRHFTMDAMGVY